MHGAAQPGTSVSIRRMHPDDPEAWQGNDLDPILFSEGKILTRGDGRTHLLIERAASVSSRKLLSMRERATRGSAISFQSHSSSSRRRFSMRSGLRFTPSRLHFRGTSRDAIKFGPSSSVSCVRDEKGQHATSAHSNHRSQRPSVG